MTYIGTSIVGYFLSTTELLRPLLTIRGDLSLNSNHKYITFTFNLPTLVSHNSPFQCSLWHLRRLRDATRLNCYQDTFRAQTADITPLSPFPHSRTKQAPHNTLKA